MSDAPSIMPEVGVGPMIGPTFIRSMPTGRCRGPKYPSLGYGCQDRPETTWFLDADFGHATSRFDAPQFPAGAGRVLGQAR